MPPFRRQESMRRSTPVPGRPDQLTPEWLTSALRPVLSDPHARVSEVATERIGEHLAYTGTLARVRVKYEPRGSGPATLVAKFPLAESSPSGLDLALSDPPEAKRAADDRARLEALFYDRIAPSLPFPGPRCHATATDPETGNLVLVFEDVTAHHLGDALTGATPAELETVLGAIARVHAAWWSCPDQLRPLPRWSGGEEVWQARQACYQERWATFVGYYGLALPRRIRDLGERLNEELVGVLARLDAAPRTVIHADLTLDKVVFAPDDPRRPVVVVDWQTVSSGPAAVDLAQLVTTSLTVADRQANEADLLRGYAQALRELRVPAADLADLRDQYVLALIARFAAVVGWVAATTDDTTTDDAAGMDRAEAVRVAALGDGRLMSALLDHDADRFC